MKRYLLCAGLIGSMAAQAADSGGLIFAGDHPRMARTEFVYERAQRDIRVTSESPDRVVGWDVDAYVLRLQTEVGPWTRLDFDVGALSADNDRLFGGVGLRYRAFEIENWRGGAHTVFRYADDVRDRVRLADGTGEAKYDLVEVDAGFTVGYRLNVADQFDVMPYLGPALSILRLSGDVEVGGGKRRFRAKEDQIIGVAAGVSLDFYETNGLRFEVRYFDDISFVVAAAIVF